MHSVADVLTVVGNADQGVALVDDGDPRFGRHEDGERRDEQVQGASPQGHGHSRPANRSRSMVTTEHRPEPVRPPGPAHRRRATSTPSNGRLANHSKGHLSQQLDCPADAANPPANPPTARLKLRRTLAMARPRQLPNRRTMPNTVRIPP